MVSKELKRFYDDNPLLYGPAGREDLEQLSSIFELYPDSVRLLSDREAVELPSFECQRCGQCCARVKYVTVSHEDVKRWVSRKRSDILDKLVVDGRRKPLMAARGKEAIRVAKIEARSLSDDEHSFEILYLTALVECAVYIKRLDRACFFLIDDGGVAACSIHDTRPRVCEKFPYYLGKYTDRRLVKEDSFCPSLREIAKKVK